MMHFNNRDIITTVITVHVMYSIYKLYMVRRVIQLVARIDSSDISVESPKLADFSKYPIWMGGIPFQYLGEEKKKNNLKVIGNLKGTYDDLCAVIYPNTVYYLILSILFLSYFLGIEYVLDLIKLFKGKPEKAES